MKIPKLNSSVFTTYLNPLRCHVLLSLLLPAAIFGADIPIDKETDDQSLICLGPIGVRVKTDHIDPGSSDSNCSQATIKFIYQGSLAANKLQLEDEIVGVNGVEFNKDFSRRMANEIDRAEGYGGKLKLSIKRKDKKIEVPFTLDVIGSYSSEFPYECRKTELIVERACDWLVRNQQADGFLNGTTGITGGAINGLAQLGSGMPKYKNSIRQIAQTMMKKFDEKEWDDPGSGLNTWHVTYGAIFLAEYYLATKDQGVLPTLKRLNRLIEIRQFVNLTPARVNELAKNKMDAPPYWFGHRLPTTGGGYACLGVNVANAVVAWELMSECGIPIDRNNFEETRNYIQRATPSGQMVYAGGLNQPGHDLDAYGRTGVLAVAYALCGDRLEYSGKIANKLAVAHDKGFFGSHASRSMGKAWGLLGMAMAHSEDIARHFNKYKYDFCLIRLSDGSFAANPGSNLQSHANIDYETERYGRKWSTAFHALIYCLPKKKLRITGGYGLPGVDNAAISKGMQVALRVGRESDFGKAFAVIDKAGKAANASEADKKTADFLKEYLNRQGKRVVRDLERVKAKGDLYQLSQLIDQHKKFFGGVPSYDDYVAPINDLLKSDESKAIISAGEKYYNIHKDWLKLPAEKAVANTKEFSSRLDSYMKISGHSDLVYGKAATKAQELLRDFKGDGDPFTAYFDHITTSGK